VPGTEKPAVLLTEPRSIEHTGLPGGRIRHRLPGRRGRLGAVALDVFIDGPADPARWADVPNLALSPHLGGMTNDAHKARDELVRFNLRTLLTGEPPRQIVVDGRGRA